MRVKIGKALITFGALNFAYLYIDGLTGWKLHASVGQFALDVPLMVFFFGVAAIGGGILSLLDPDKY